MVYSGPPAPSIRSYKGTMPGCSSCPVTRASSRKRARSCGSKARGGRSSFSATSRPGSSGTAGPPSSVAGPGQVGHPAAERLGQGQAGGLPVAADGAVAHLQQFGDAGVGPAVVERQADDFALGGGQPLDRLVELLPQL